MNDIKRYNLALSESMFKDVSAVAEQEHTTLLEVIKRFVRLGLLVYAAQKNGSRFIIRTMDEEKEVLLLL